MTTVAGSNGLLDRASLTDEDALELHELILDDDCDGLSALIDELKNQDMDCEHLCRQEVSINPLEEDHALNGLPLTAYHRAALLTSQRALVCLYGRNPQTEKDLPLRQSGFTPLHVACTVGSNPVVNFLAVNGASVNKPDADGLHPLHLAARAGHVDVAALLVVQGAAVNSNDNSGRRPLHYASLEGHSKMVTYLLKRDADVNAVDNLGQTALHLGQVKGHLAVTEVLLGRGADVDIQDRDGRTALIECMLHSSTVLAPKDSHYACAVQLITSAKCENLTDNSGTTALHISSARGRVDMAGLLVKNGAGVHFKNKEGETPLYGAVTIQTIDFLLTEGASVNTINNRQRTPLHVFAARDDVTVEMMTSLIMSGANVNSKDVDDENALFNACRRGNMCKVELLLENGANLNELNSRRKSCIHICLEHEFSDLAIQLLNKYSARCDELDSSGNSPLHVATQKNMVTTVKCLLDKKVDENKLNSAGLTASTIAASSGWYDILKILLGAGGHLEPRVGDWAILHSSTLGDLETTRSLVKQGIHINCQDNCKRTPLHLATAARHHHVALLLLESGASSGFHDYKHQTPLHVMCHHLANIDMCAAMLKCADVEVNSLDNDGQTALHLAMANPDCVTEIIELILNTGGNPDTQDSHGNTAVYLGLKRIMDPITPQQMQIQISKISRVLETSDIAINKTNASGNTLLHLAAKQNLTDTVLKLIQRNCNVNVVNRAGETPLLLSCHEGNSEVTSLLLCNGSDVLHGDVGGRTPLHHAVLGGSCDVIEQLINADVQIDAVTHEGQSAVHIAVSDNMRDLIEVLLMNNPDLTIKDTDGRTALHLASRCCDLSVVKIITSQGANINARDKHRRTPLHYSILNCDIGVMRWLLSHGATLNAQSESGSTPLHEAIVATSFDHVNCLVGANGTMIDLRNNINDTVLHLASALHETDILELLIASDADVNAINNEGNSPLIVAVINNNIPGAFILLDYDADISITNKAGQVALWLAAGAHPPDHKLLKRLVQMSSRQPKTIAIARAMMENRRDIDGEAMLAALGLD